MKCTARNRKFEKVQRVLQKLGVKLKNLQNNPRFGILFKQRRKHWKQLF